MFPGAFLSAIFLTAAPSAGPQHPSVWFVVSADSQQGYRLSSLFRVAGDRILPPASSNEACAEFPPEYFESGRSYRYLYGGSVAGTIAPQGLSASVTPASATKLGQTEFALATDARIYRKTSTSRRTPTAAQRDKALAQARALLAARQTSPALLRRLTLQSLTSTDINGDGRQDWIATFEVPETDAPSPTVRSLFVVAEAVDGGDRPAIVHYHRGGGESFLTERYIDQADIDGDGHDELITRSQGWEGYSYRVYSQRGGAWKLLFEGGGCAI